MTTLNVPLDRIAADARQIHFGRLLLTLLAGLFFGLGWLVAKLVRVVWFALAWVIAAVRVGWQEGRKANAAGRAK